MLYLPVFFWLALAPRRNEVASYYGVDLWRWLHEWLVVARHLQRRDSGVAGQCDCGLDAVSRRSVRFLLFGAVDAGPAG